MQEPVQGYLHDRTEVAELCVACMQIDRCIISVCSV